MISMESQRKYKKYCCICKGIYRGMLVDGRKISLHRFPLNLRLKRVWIQRCKTVMRTFKWNEHKRLCSEHFPEFNSPTLEYTLPSLFPTESGATKEFLTWKLDENQMTVTEACEDISMEDNDDATTSLFLSQECHPLDVSLHLHDYCHPFPPRQLNLTKRCMDTQTEHTTISSEVQTDESQTNIKKFGQAATQTDTSRCDIGIQCKLPLLTFDDIKHSDDLVSFYTGIPSRAVFEAVFDEIKEEAEARTSSRKLNHTLSSGGRPKTLSVLNEFFMVLMRLRLGLLLEDLSFRFCISTSQCSNIIARWINYLVVQLSFLVQWPSSETIKKNMPIGFRERFPNTRIIVDCTELFSETSSTLSLKNLMYSDYKSHMTHTALVGISPNGVVTFVSNCWVGSTSDKKITQECGLLDMLEEGDAIMTDKGFTISDLTTPRGIELIIPPFKKKGKQFTKREVNMTKDIARLRIHVERQMERIKNFRILQGNVTITQGRNISKLFKICTYLSNLWPPLVRE